MDGNRVPTSVSFTLITRRGYPLCGFAQHPSRLNASLSSVRACRQELLFLRFSALKELLNSLKNTSTALLTSDGP